MKRIAFLIITIVISINSASGQAAILVLLLGDKAATENFYFSLKGGLNFSSFNGLPGAEYKPGVHFGLVNNIRINDRWDFIPEFMPMSWKGAKNLNFHPSGIPQLDSLSPSETSISGNLNYIDIPILMRYKLTEKWRFEFGPQVSILTSAKDRYTATFRDDDEFTYTINRKADFRTMDFGFLLSLGYSLTDFTTGKGIEFYVSFYRGFQNISKIQGENYNNQVFQISASFPFILPSEE